ncbi:hypothetical protein BH18ACI2_BH18ACI2_17730 [soil metagenome]
MDAEQCGSPQGSFTQRRKGAKNVREEIRPELFKLHLEIACFDPSSSGTFREGLLFLNFEVIVGDCLQMIFGV